MSVHLRCFNESLTFRRPKKIVSSSAGLDVTEHTYPVDSARKVGPMTTNSTCSISSVPYPVVGPVHSCSTNRLNHTRQSQCGNVSCRCVVRGNVGDERNGGGSNERTHELR